MRFLFILLLLCWSLSANINDTETTKILTFLKYFSNAYQQDVHVIDLVRNVASDSQNFISLAGPVGALIAKSMNVTFEDNSDEQKALKLLSEQMNHNFKVMKDQTDQVQRQIVHEVLVFGYGTSVSDRINNLVMLFSFDTSSGKSRNVQYDIFTDRCKSAEGPREILLDMERFYVTNCLIPTKEDMKNYVLVQQAVKEFEQNSGDMRFGLERKYLNTKSKVLQVVIGSDREQLLEIIEKIRKINATAPEQMEEILRELSRYSDRKAQSSCILSAVLTAHEDKRKYLFQEVKLVAFDLLKTEFFVMACANSTLKGNPTAIEQWTHFARSMVEKIASHIANYAETILNRAWPDVIAYWAYSAIPRGPVTIENYNHRADLISKKLELRGSERLRYQILITEAMSEKNDFAVSLSEHAIYSRFEIRDIMVHIFGFEGEPDYRAGNATDWFGTKEKELQETIQENMVQTTSADSLLTTLVINSGPVIEEDNYRAVILLKKKAYRGINVHIATGESFLTLGFWNATSSIHSFINPRIWSAHEVKVYFFL